MCLTGRASASTRRHWRSLSSHSLTRMEAGLLAPVYRQNEYMVYATIRQAKEAAGQVAGNGDVNGDNRANDSRNDSLSDSVNDTYQAIKANPGIQRKRISELTGKSIPTIDETKIEILPTTLEFSASYSSRARLNSSYCCKILWA